MSVVTIIIYYGSAVALFLIGVVKKKQAEINYFNPIILTVKPNPVEKCFSTSHISTEKKVHINV